MTALADWIAKEPDLRRNIWVLYLRDQIIPLGPYSYIIYKEHNKTFVKNGLTGQIEFSGSDTDAIQYAVDALPTGGGKIIIMRGKYVLSSPIAIDKNGVHISGESLGGDLFFTADSNYYGISNKIATVLVAEGIDAFRIGFNKFIFGVSIENIAISGTSREESAGTMPDNYYTSGVGINIARGNTLRIRNVEVIRKEYGVKIDTGSFAYDKVVDVLIAENLLFAYNVYGIQTRGWIACSRFRNIYGYINQKSLLDLELLYDNIIENVWSNSDAWNASNAYEAPIVIYAKRDVKIVNVSVYGQKGSALCPVPLMTLCPQITIADSTEWFRGHIIVINPTLFETANDAIKIPVGCKGLVEIYNPHIGSTGIYGYAGGSGRIVGCAVKNEAGSDVVVKVRGGYVRSEQNLDVWFVNVPYQNIENVENYRTRNSGSAIIPAGSTSVTVNHGLVLAPSKVLVTPTANVKCWVSNITSTSFRINIDTAQTSNITVYWYAEV